MTKPILCLDFDGVVHKYSKGWQDGQIYDPPTEGFFDWLNEAWKHFQIVIYSSRSASTDGIAAMKSWFALYEYEWLKSKNPDTGCYPEGILTFASEKPPAFLTIDDRAIQFDGHWENSFWEPQHLLQFKPWTQRS